MDAHSGAGGAVSDVERTASRWFLLLIVMYVGFIGAATFSVDAGSVSLERGLDKLGGLASGSATQLVTIHDLRDVATNLLLFLPLGVLVALRRGVQHLRPLSLWLAFGTLVSLGVEIGQSFTDRWADPVDLLTNTTGYLLGFGLTFVALRRFAFAPQALLGLSEVHSDDQVRTVAGLSFLYLCVYAALQLVPFDVSVRLSHLHAKLLAPPGYARIILDPFAHLSEGTDGFFALLYAAAGIAPAAALKFHLDVLRKRGSVVVTVWYGICVAAALEFAQIFIMSRTADVAAVLLAPPAAVLGWLLATGWERLQGVRAAEGRSARRDRIYGIALASVLYIVVLALMAWAPFDYESDLRVVRDKVREETNLIPFRLHFSTHSLGAVRDIVKESSQLAPLGLMTMLFLQARGRAESPLRASLFAGAVCTLVGVGLESGQAFFAGRYVDITDVLLAGAGGIAGSALWSVFRKSNPREQGRRGRTKSDSSGPR